MDIRHGSPAGIDWTNDAALTDHDEQALEAIRRQLDIEFPHFTGTLAATGPHSAEIASANGSAPRRRGRTTTVLGLVVACAGGSAATVLVTALYQAPTPAAIIRQRATRPTVAPVSDATSVTEPAAFAIPSAVVTPPPVQDVAREAPAPPVERARPSVPVAQLASERARAAWDIVKEHVTRPSGELAAGSRSRPEAP